MLIFVAGCKGPATKKVDPPPPEPKCGDGTINAGEDCEGSDLNGASCQSLGFDEGQLGCGKTDCKYVTSLCSKRCGNGVKDPGEECDGTLGVGVCANFGYQACSA